MLSRKLCALILSIAMIFTLAVPAMGAEAPTSAPAAAADWTRTEPGGKYVTVRLAYPEGENLSWGQQQDLCVRYADTKEPVSLVSDYIQGYLFATVPASEAGRALEVFQGAPAQFQDCGVGNVSAPMGTEPLNLRGVILGTTAGTLDGDRPITRAEATVLVARYFGLNGTYDTVFSDVPEDSWYADAVAACLAAGVVSKDETFSPARNVKRSEFTAMIYRGMRYVGWIEEPGDEELGLADASQIPTWAEDAYRAFEEYGNIGILDVNGGETDTDETTYTAAPEKAVLRGEAVTFLYRAILRVPCYPYDLAIQWGFDQEMPVLDGSTSTLPYTNAVYGALFYNYENHPQYPGSHSKSYQSYERLLSGEADLLFAAASPTEDMMEKAKADGVEMELVPIAYDAMVFFTNAENSVDNITMDQIHDIYVDNKYTSWKEIGGEDAELVPYCRNADSGSQALMEQFFLKEGEDVNPEIRKETTSVSMASVLTDVHSAKREDPLAYGIGYSIYYYYLTTTEMLLPENSLKLLKINGIAPTEETIADNRYPLAGRNYCVIKKSDPQDSLSRKMIEFMLSPEGQLCVVNAGYGALKTDF